MFGRSVALRQRAGWGLADQAVSSITNAVLAILVARSVDASSFGAFGLAFSLYSIALGISRALCSQPLSIRYASAAPDAARTAAARSTGCSLVLGVVAGGICAAAGLVIGGVSGDCLIALGVTLPGLLLQDAWRYVFFTVARPAAALVNDVFWGVAQIGLLVVVLRSGGSVALMLGAWGAAAAMSAVLGAGQARTWPAPRAAGRWLAEHRRVAPFLAAEYAVNLGAFNAALAVVAALGELAVVGAIRGAQVLLGPVRVLTQAAQSFGLAEVARRAAARPDGLLRDCALVSFALAAAPAIATGLFVLMPDRWGAALLGDTWTGAHAVLVAVGAQLVATGVLGGALLGLQTLGRTRSSFAASLLQAPFTLVLGVGGLFVAGPVGAATGFALAHCIAPVTCWLLLVRHQRRALTTDSYPAPNRTT